MNGSVNSLSPSTEGNRLSRGCLTLHLRETRVERSRVFSHDRLSLSNGVNSGCLASRQAAAAAGFIESPSSGRRASACEERIARCARDEAAEPSIELDATKTAGICSLPGIAPKSQWNFFTISR